MLFFVRKALATGFFRLTPTLAIILVLAQSGLAGIRRPGDFSPNINPDDQGGSGNIFGQGGPYSIGGGVFFNGKVSYVFESDSAPTPVPISKLKLVSDVDGNILIRHKKILYKLDIHDDLACPLSKFTHRNGLIAFTIPPLRDRNKLKEQGLVKAPLGYIAKEFSDTSFGPLLARSDFAKIAPLPVSISESDMIQKINREIHNSPNASLERAARGTYIEPI